MQQISEEFSKDTSLPAGLKPEDVIPIPKNLPKRDPIHYGISVSDCYLLLNNNQNPEVISDPILCPIPNSPAVFSGLLYHRGEIIPIYNMNTYLDIESESDKSQLSKRINKSRASHILSEFIIVMNITENDNDPEFQHNTIPIGFLIDDLPKPHIIRKDTPSCSTTNIPEKIEPFIERALYINNCQCLEINWNTLSIDLIRSID